MYMGTEKKAAETRVHEGSYYNYTHCYEVSFSFALKGPCSNNKKRKKKSSSNIAVNGG